MNESVGRERPLDHEDSNMIFGSSNCEGSSRIDCSMKTLPMDLCMMQSFSMLNSTGVRPVLHAKSNLS